jgi:hypothetical protein
LDWIATLAGERKGKEGADKVAVQDINVFFLNNIFLKYIKIIFFLFFKVYF